MHEDEAAIDEALVTRLIAQQFPQLSQLPVRAVRSTGTVNAIFRLGADLCVRLPRLEKWAPSLEKELFWLPKLGPRITLRVPGPVASGCPTSEYPLPWAIFRWIEGEPYREDVVGDECQAARDLAEFVLELRCIDPSGGPRAGRRPLRTLDAVTRTAIEETGLVIDGGAVVAAWERGLAATEWNGAAVWIHTDLLRPNLLARGGRLCAVIDFGGAGIGDPAADVIAAWSVFSKSGRAAYRDALDVDDGTWDRARAYALHQALQIIPYYSKTNPEFVALAKRTVQEVLSDD